ncbi:MAG: hypothetical protein AAFY53_10775 [Pseudomonadota bacterium]
MTIRARRQTQRQRVGMALVIAAGLGLGGCGGVDSIELNGGVFDALGVGGDLLASNRKEVKLQPRPGIVMPPDANRLPAPGSGSVGAVAPGQQWPVGPESRQAAERAKLRAEHDAFCKTALLQQKTQDPDGAPPTGPLGSCAPGLGERLFGTRQSNEAEAKRRAAAGL